MMLHHRGLATRIPSTTYGQQQVKSISLYTKQASRSDGMAVDNLYLPLHITKVPLMITKLC